jgi:octopine/nopaline transport system permease protein
VQESYFALIGFGADGWGRALLIATGMTCAVAVAGFLLGSAIGSLIAWAKLSGSFVLRRIGTAYTTVLRGIPDLLVIYLFYFGGSAALGTVAGFFGADGFIGMPAFVTGVLAIGIVSGAYQAEVLRGAFLATPRGEIEAAKAVGMRNWTAFRRIIAPLVLRLALPGIGNTWQLVLKETALISVTGLVELLRQSQIAAGSTRRPFEFYLTAILLYLAITWISTLLFRRAEARTMLGVRRSI